MLQGFRGVKSQFYTNPQFHVQNQGGEMDKTVYLIQMIVNCFIGNLFLIKSDPEISSSKPCSISPIESCINRNLDLVLMTKNRQLARSYLHSYLQHFSSVR